MKNIAIQELLSFLPVKETNISDQYMINGIIQLDVNNNSDDVLFWCNDKNILSLEKISKGTVISSQKIKEVTIPFGLKYIIVENPRKAFADVINNFFVKKRSSASIARSAVISPDVILGKNISIGEHVVIEEGCEIGDDSIIMHNTVINANTCIGKKVVIGSNNTIGGVGFGYEKSETGNYEVIPHIGNVIIKDRVEIGNNTCIDRAVLGSTIINENVKIDNLVHIAHGVNIGANSLIIAHAMIGGSTDIGKNVWVSPGALLLNKIFVGDNSLIGMGAVVIKQVEAGTIVAGNPSKFIKNIK